MHLKPKHTKEQMQFLNFAFGKFRKSPEYPDRFVSERLIYMYIIEMHAHLFIQ